jgi:hypothetical protein
MTKVVTLEVQTWTIHITNDTVDWTGSAFLDYIIRLKGLALSHCEPILFCEGNRFFVAAKVQVRPCQSRSRHYSPRDLCH